MKTWLRPPAARLLILLTGMLLAPVSGSAQFQDQHSVEALVSALKSPISAQAAKQARDFDDKLMSEGQVEGNKVYLVTDERSTRTNDLVKKLLESMGEDTQHWVVRVLDTDPKTVNAFVTGGKYVYVFTGLIDEATSDDELAFVLSHELGHSLLKQNERQQKDASTTVANIAVLAALLSKKRREKYLDFAKVATSSYSRVDEEEADAIAVTIARRAGFDPLRGTDFFSRGKRQNDEAEQEIEQHLAKMHQEVQQAQATCQQWTQQYNSSWQYKTQENARKVNAICAEAENRRVQYNQAVQQYNIAKQQQRANSFVRTHPPDQNRIAAIAAITDYVHSRRDLQSLSKFEQSYRVMLALKHVDSVLLTPPVQAAAAAPTSATDVSPKKQTDSSLEEQLVQLKRVREKGLITDIEYERKRQQILNRY